MSNNRGVNLLHHNKALWQDLFATKHKVLYRELCLAFSHEPLRLSLSGFLWFCVANFSQFLKSTPLHWEIGLHSKGEFTNDGMFFHY